MDSASENVLNQLDEKIEKLRALGVERGLSASEIDDCILKCVNPEKNVKSSKKRKCSTGFSRGRHICLIASGVWAGFWVFCAGVYMLAQVHEPTEHFLTRALQPLLYPVLKGVRLVGLPILRRYNGLAVYYDEECLVLNPFYKPSSPPCDICEPVKSVKRQPYDNFKVDVDDATFFDPTVLTGGLKPVSLSKLMNVCQEHILEMTDGVHIIHSSSPRIYDLASVLNLTEEEAKADPKFHLEWRTRMVGPARVLRTIYSRPSFINYRSEVSLEKTIFVDSPNAESYPVIPLPYGNEACAWYVQSAGRRRLMLMPKSDCASKCKSFQITMNPGDMLYLFTDPWTVTSLPVIGEGDEPTETSVAFIGTYTTD